MIHIKDYRLSSRLYSHATADVLRGIRVSDQKRVLIKLLKQRDPTGLSALKKEFRIIGSINRPGVTSIIEPLFDQDIPGIVYEDFGGELLAGFIAVDGFTLLEKLIVARKTALCLNDIHAGKILHNSIEPATILVNPLTLDTAITGLDQAVLMGDEQDNTISGNPNTQGNLIYMAPEMSGRMNKKPDHRSDLYSLGVTLYELFSGRPPFVSDDPLTLTHLHLSVKPEPVMMDHTIIQEKLSPIILKLLAKNPDRRFCSALSLADQITPLIEMAQKTIATPALPGAPFTGNPARVTSNTIQKRFFSFCKENRLVALIANTIKQSLVDSRVDTSEKKFNALYANAVEGIFRATPDGQFTQANPAMAKIMGYASPKSLITAVKSIPHQLVADETLTENFFNRVLNEGGVSDFEVELFQKNQTRIWVSASAKIVYDAKTKTSYVEGRLIDITEKKKIQAAEQKKEAAEAASLAKTNFLANMSHEIRTPMNAIIGFTTVLMQTELSSRQQEHLSKIAYASKSLLGIIDDILDLSKIEAGKLTLNNAVFNLNDIITHLKDIFSLSIWEKGIELNFYPDDQLPALLSGDDLRLRQVLMNLISNAVKFTHTGSITVTARVREKREQRIIIEFAVTDTGIGIPEEYIPELFNAFSQADTSITRKFGGTGLGLTICNHLVEMMGGNMTAESDYGKGSTFTFSAVFDRVSNIRSERVSSSIDDTTAYPLTDPDELAEKLIRLKGLNILIAEDNILNQVLIKTLLERAGAVVTIAANGREAVELTKKTSVHAVLMDIQMPEMDGYEATLQIRNQSGCEQLPIIALTAHAMVEEKEKCLSSGMTDFLSKPIDYNEMISVLLRWTQTATDSTAPPPPPESTHPVSVSGDRG